MIECRYYQYAHNKKNDTYKLIGRIDYEGLIVLDKRASMLLNFNRGLDCPIDEETLFTELANAKESMKTEDFRSFCEQHPLTQRFLYVGQSIETVSTFKTDAENIKTEKSLCYSQYFSQYWASKGIQRPEHSDSCVCSQRNLCDNHFVFDTATSRLFVVGSECKRKFELAPKCKTCGAKLRIDVAVVKGMLCVECWNKKEKSCQVCKCVITKGKCCDECSKYGRKRFKFGCDVDKSYLTVYLQDPHKFKQRFRNYYGATHLASFVKRIDLFA